MYNDNINDFRIGICVLETFKLFSKLRVLIAFTIRILLEHNGMVKI